MTTCETGAERVPVDAGLGVDPEPGVSTTDLLDVDDDSEGAIWSLRRDTDVHGAAVRGLAQYLWTLRVEALGRVIKFSRVTEHSADAYDEGTEYPVAAVSGGGQEGLYAGPSMTPVVVSTEEGRRHVMFSLPNRMAAGLFITSEYRHENLVAEITCGSELERAAVCATIEDMIDPHLARGGLGLRLRHYHGVVARYSLIGQTRDVTPSEITAGSWIVRFRFTVKLPRIRVHRRPFADPQIQITTDYPR
mgnify:CR=1 FL=1